MSWSEILIVAVVALIVVGPKDLPGMFREMGKFTAKAKRMAREFTRAMEDAADDAGIVDVQKTFKAATNPAKAALDSVTDTMREAVDFDAMDPESETAKLAAKKKADKDAAQARAKAVKDANAAAEAQAKDFAKKPAEPKKAAAKKSAAKKPAAKKPAAKKPAPAKVAKTKTATKTAAKKAPAKKAKSG